jgi:hypothetical protein
MISGDQGLGRSSVESNHLPPLHEIGKSYADFVELADVTPKVTLKSQVQTSLKKCRYTSEAQMLSRKYEH